MKKRNTPLFLALLMLIGIQIGYSKSISLDPPIKKSISITAPTITATGNTAYCPLTQTKIATAVTITHDVADPTTEAVYIQIASGYVIGTDQLLLTNTVSHPTITSSWNATEGKLTLSSPTAGTQVNYSEFESAIKDVAYYNSSPNPSGTRNFSISLGNGQANYLPSNGHYYEYVPSLGITWTNAKAAAALKTFYGLQGYLATLTAADEAQLAGKQAPGTGWIGGTDEAVEGVWRWVTGPEGLANGGTGIVFWNGTASGSTPNFAFWNTGEPNQNGNEDYAHITAPGVGIPGSWNDLSNTGSASGSYQPKGYIVEYGGMPGDPTLQLSASTTLSIAAQITTTTPASHCGPGSVTLSATASYGTISWYNTNTGGTVLGTGTNYTTPTLSNTTSYYVTTSECAVRTEIKATIITQPNYPNTTNSISYCLNNIATPLTATADANNTLNWYTVASGGTSSATSPTPTTSSSGITKFYVSQTNSLTACESPRAEINVTVNALPNTPSVTPIFYCLNNTATALTATADANNTLNWYTVASGGTSSATSPTPTTSSSGITKYYVSQTNTLTACESPRAEINVTVNALPNAPVVAPISYCLNNTATALTATADANNTLNWYTVASGGASNSTSPTPTTSSSGITKYYVSQTNTLTACEGPRAEITVTINALPNTPVVAPISYCLNNTATALTATADANSTLNWYTVASGGASSSTSPTPTTSSSGITKYYVSQTNTLTACEGPRAEITVTINALPTTPGVAPISYCLNDIATPLTFTADANSTLNWYTVASGGTSSATSPTPSTSSSGITKYYVSQTNTLTVCEGPRAEITVTINALPNTPNVTPVAYCLNTTAIPLTATADANSTLNWYTISSGGTSSATSPTPTTSSSGITKYYVSQTNTLTACEGPRAEITVTINALPTVNDITITQCDTDLISDGKTSFNLTVNNSLISSNYTNESFKYYTSLNGAMKDIAADLITNELAFQNITPTSMDIWTRISNSYGCHSVSKITLNVPTTNFHPATNFTYSVCDDFLDANGNNTTNNSNTDGIASFDLSPSKAIILSQLPSNQTYTINYYRTQADALSQTNAISTITNYRNIGYPNTQTLWIRIESNLDNSCVGLGPYINLNVEKLPNIELNSTNLICSNIPTFFVTLDAGFLNNSSSSNFNYRWGKDGVDLNITTPTLGVNANGVYTVEVTTPSGCSRTRTIQVTASNSATITSIDIVDLVDNNTVTVNVTGQGDYEYSMDYLNGVWQDSNFFTNVPGGIHQVVVNDKNGCGVATQEITVLSIPKFFTPNNDSYNDVWIVKGMESYPNSDLKIFDRYGKFIKELTPGSTGWDGTFNGQELPSSDYWFVLKLDPTSPEKRGHFSLKR